MRPFVKAITGIANQNVENVALLARIAELAGVQALDVSANVACVKVARQAFHGQLFASAVSAEDLRLAVEAGADVAELGNFDDMYAHGDFITAAEVMTLAQESLLALAGKAPLCVTIPGHLSRDTQVEMLHTLADMGVAMVQTEGAIRLLNDEKVQLLSVEEKAAMSLENARFLSEIGRLPVMVASGISSKNTVDALQTGAIAVGIGSSFNKLASEEAMFAELLACLASLQNVLQAIA
jgi:hypothetical protein